jgi:hypothetical protein
MSLRRQQPAFPGPDGEVETTRAPPGRVVCPRVTAQRPGVSEVPLGLGRLPGSRTRRQLWDGEPRLVG